MKKSIVIATIALLLLPYLPAHSATDDIDWKQVNRIGLEQDNGKDYIASDLWENYTQDQAVKSLNKIPSILTSPSYLSLATKFLTSKTSKLDDEQDSPKFIAKRIETLIRIGAFSQALDLYNKVNEQYNISENFELSMVNIMLTLTNGSIAPICLDVQATSSNYRDMPTWRELSSYCQVRFGKNDKIKFDDLKFKNLPDLKNILISDRISISQPKSIIGTLIAFNDQKISAESYNQQAKNISNISNLKIKLATRPAYKNQKTYMCYAIEAAKRGLINQQELETIYKDASFSETQLDNTSGEIKLHPCNVPAYFYQKIQKAKTGQKPINNLITPMFTAMRPIPVQAIAPIINNLTPEIYNNHNLWDALIILGSLDIDISADLLKEQQNHPLIQIAQNKMIRINPYKEWLNDETNENRLKLYNIDESLPLYLSQILSDKKINFHREKHKKEYGNLFSLTYAKKWLGLGLGFNDFIANTYNDDNHAKLIISLLGTTGHRNVTMIHPDDITVILSSLKAYKLEKEAVTLLFEYLQ